MNGAGDMDDLAGRLFGVRASGSPPPRWMLVAVFLLAFGLYANSIRNGFTFDDRWIIERNPLVHDLNHLPEIWTSGYWGETKLTRAYRPLTLTTFALDHALHGPGPAGYHLVNALLHALVSLLVVILSLRIGVPPAGALIGALLFAAHPIHTEAVASVVGRAELLAALAFIGCILVWLRYRETGRILPLAGLGFLYGLGILCKEQVVMLPAVLFASEAAFHRLRNREGRVYLLRAILVCGAALAFVLWLRAVATGSAFEASLMSFPGYPGMLFGEPFLVRCLTACKVLAKIARLLLFPIPLSPDYSFNALPLARGPERSVLAGGLLALLLLWIWIRAWRVPRRFLMIALAVAVYAPLSNIFFPITLLLGERTLYLATIGLAVLAGDWLGEWLPGLRRRSFLAAASALVMVITLWGIRTIDRNADWRDQRTLFAAAARTTPASARVRMNYGAELLARGELEGAVAQFEAAIAILPRYAKAHSNLAVAYQRLDRLPEAVREAARAAALQPRQPAYWMLLGRLYLQQGRTAEARRVCRRVLAIDPSNPEAREMLEALDSSR